MVGGDPHNVLFLHAVNPKRHESPQIPPMLYTQCLVHCLPRIARFLHRNGVPAHHLGLDATGGWVEHEVFSGKAGVSSFAGP